MRTHPRAGAFGVAFLMTVAAHAGTTTDPFAAPPGYYDGATGTGATLKAQLLSAMSAGHIERTYGDFRYSAAFHDQDPDNSSRILLCYNRASVPATWDAGSTWNREHVWPQSRQPGSASNSTRGPLADPHALRPANPSINSSRGNDPFGFATTTGGHRSLGAYYFPGDADKGDIARTLFYMDTRWGPSNGLSLVDGNPVGFQMGGLSDAIAWHYLDAPDTFERRRNHAIYSPILNPQYFTNNRNAFIDLPEVVWSLYVDQMNDSTLWLGNAPAADGSSEEVVFLNALVGGDATAEVTLNKSGMDGTYFGVTVGEGLTSSIDGRHNAFAIHSGGETRTLSIGIAPDLAAAPGMYLREIVVDNLDVTLQGGPDVGGNDADDVITVDIAVFEPAIASLSDSGVVTEITIDLGTIEPGAGDAADLFGIFNLASVVTGAPMDVDLVAGTGDTAALTVGFDPVVSMMPGSGEIVSAVLDDALAGDFAATYTFAAFNDRGLFADPGASQDLVVHLVGTVADACPADLAAPFGTLNIFDVMAYINLYNAQDPAADLAAPFGTFNIFDIMAYIDAYGAGCP